MSLQTILITGSAIDSVALARKTSSSVLRGDFSYPCGQFLFRNRAGFGLDRCISAHVINCSQAPGITNKENDCVRAAAQNSTQPSGLGSKLTQPTWVSVELSTFLVIYNMIALITEQKEA